MSCVLVKYLVWKLETLILICIAFTALEWKKEGNKLNGLLVKAHNFFHCMSFMIHVIMSSELLCSLPFLNMLGIELVEYFYWSKFRKKKKDHATLH